MDANFPWYPVFSPALTWAERSVSRACVRTVCTSQWAAEPSPGFSQVVTDNVSFSRHFLISQETARTLQRTPQTPGRVFLWNKHPVEASEEVAPGCTVTRQRRGTHPNKDHTFAKEPSSRRVAFGRQLVLVPRANCVELFPTPCPVLPRLHLETGLGMSTGATEIDNATKQDFLKHRDLILLLVLLP